MKANHRRDLVAMLVVALLALGLSWTPLFDRLEALSADLMLYARHATFGQRHPAAKSRAVIVALDEQTYKTPPFANLPKVLWTPQVAKVQDAVLAGGAKVIGYDVIFPTSLESHLPGYERPFLLSLLTAAREGRVVLGKVQHREAPVAPFPSQSMVVGHERNIRSLNMLSDIDDVIRHVPLFFQTAGGAAGKEPSMALELAARTLGQRPAERGDGTVALGGYVIPGSEGNAARINFQGDGDIPTYSLADLHACAEAGDAGYFARHFKDKVVILGAVLDVEDRKLTGKRLMTETGAGASVDPCRPGAPVFNPGFERDTIPGAYIHASAINDLLRGDFLRETGRPVASAIAVAMALLVAWASLALRPAASTLAGAALVAGWTTEGLFALQGGLLLPVLPVLAAMALSYSLMQLYRYMIADQQKLRIRRLFSLYLAPSVVDRMVEADRLPELGGEMREVTVWFSDLADFTHLSEGLSPTELVSLMNRYFSVVTDIIEAHGGFVDKYIGDAIVAVFGAPLDDPSHAGHAVAAALTARDRLEEMNEAGEFGDRRIATRTGINTGLALVGNVGSSRRFNYTVMGDTVNLASRLEGANKAVGTTILVSGDAAARLPESMVLREVGMIRVKGRQTALKIYEPLAMKSRRLGRRDAKGAIRSRMFEPPTMSVPHGRSEGTDLPLGGKRAERVGGHFISENVELEAARAMARDFASSQEAYRQRRFDEASRLLAPYADDPVAARLLARAEAMALAPPPEDWDGVENLTEK